MATITHDQRHAFSHLGEKARAAHYEGDGLAVNHFSAIALSEIEARTKDKNLTLPLSDLAWAVIFPLHWLIDGYMVSQAEKTLNAFSATSDLETEQLEVLKAYFWLVQQPLADSDQFKTKLPAASLRWVTTDSPVEFGLLLRSCIELLWYRDPGGGEWQTLVAAWVSKLPKQHANDLNSLEARLREQVAFTAFATKPKLPAIGGGSRPQFAWLRDIWSGALQCEWAQVDEIAERECARIAVDSPLGRYLFDVRHFMRFHGKWGDDQAVGLSRRRLTISRFPLLIFDELRAAHGHILVGNLFRGKKNSGAHERFHVFRLAMLRELESLRRWDLFAWFAAIRFRAEVHLEVLRHDASNVEYAAKTVIDAVTSLSFDHNEPRHRDAVLALDFGTDDSRAAVVQQLLNAPPLYAYEALEVLEQLGDAIPVILFEEVAVWSLQYLDLATKKKLRGSKAFPLEFWGNLFPFAGERSPLWEKLAPEIEKDARNTLVWQSAPSYLGWFIIKAPEHLAQRIIETMANTSGGPADAHFRWAIILDVFDERPALTAMIVALLPRIFPSPGIRYCLKSRLPDRPDLFGDTNEAKANVRKRLDEMLAKAIYRGKGSTVDQPVYTGAGIWHIEWHDADAPIVESLMATVDHPQVLSVYNRAFLGYLRGVLHTGVPSLVEKVAPRLNAWLREPPLGIDPFPKEDGPFSSFHFNWSSQPQIVRELTLLAHVVWERSRAGNTSNVREWILTLLGAVPPEAAAAVIATALPIAHHTADFQRAEMLSACRSVLQTVWHQFADKATAGSHLAEAIDNYRWFLKSGYKLGSTEIHIPSDFAATVMSSIAPHLTQFAKASSPELRRAVAALLNGQMQARTLAPEFDRLLDALKNDGRARVRTAAQRLT